MSGTSGDGDASLIKSDGIDLSKWLKISIMNTILL